MTKQESAQHDLMSLLVANHTIQAGNTDSEEKIAIERLELFHGHPAGLRLALGSVHALSRIRRRRPIFLLPPTPPYIVDRSAELETLRQSLIARHVVDLHGPDGAGKSTVASALTHALDLNHFPDGAVFVSSPMRYPDLLQGLFDVFYESDTPVKITLEQTRTYLSNLRVLVVLDNVDLGPKQIDPILDALTEAAVLVVGAERTALGRGRAVPLRGLPRPAAVELFRSVCDPTPGPDDSPIIDQICILLNDVPLSVASIAAQASHTNQTLTQLLTDLQDRRPWSGPGCDSSVGPSLEEIVLILDGTDRRLITLVSAFGAAGTSSESLEMLMRLPMTDFQERVERLQALKLLSIEGPPRASFLRKTGENGPTRLKLVSGYDQTARNWLVDDVVRRQVVDYFVTRLARGDKLTGLELPGLLGAIEECGRNGWLDQLKPLVQAADRSLALLRLWAEWQNVLELTRRAAQAGGDRALEAWALHQCGSIQGALNDFERGIHQLRTGLKIRQALGDTIGAALSERNIQILERLVPKQVNVDTAVAAESPTRSQEAEAQAHVHEAEPEERAETAPQLASSRHRWRLRLAFLSVLVVILIGTVALRYVSGLSQSGAVAPDFSVSWEFGDAWNALNGETWTQELLIVVEGADGDIRYSVNGKPVGEMFEIVLPLCKGAQGTIHVDSDTGQNADVQFAFDSPFCD
jgi:hypothetical protein